MKFVCERRKRKQTILYMLINLSINCRHIHFRYLILKSMNEVLFILFRQIYHGNVFERYLNAVNYKINYNTLYISTFCLGGVTLSGVENAIVPLYCLSSDHSPAFIIAKPIQPRLYSSHF